MGVEQQAVDGIFWNKIFCSDEEHFTLGVYVMEQNCRIWDPENPQVIEECNCGRRGLVSSVSAY